MIDRTLLLLSALFVVATGFGKNHTLSPLRGRATARLVEKHFGVNDVDARSCCPCAEYPTQPGRIITAGLLAFLVATLLGQDALAEDVTERLALGGTLAMATQCQQVSGAGDENTCGAAAALMPDLTLNLTDQDQVYLLFDFALGNSLNVDSPFTLAPWAASLEEDVHNINGSNRSYLLVATYSHDFQFATDHALQLTGGILDTGVFLDQNAYASDENTQFMNVAFANSHSSYLPTYNPGGAVEWRYQDWTLSALGLNGGENQAGESFGYYAAGLAYRLQTAWGEGNYRLMYFTTTPDFSADPGGELDRAEGAVLSLDQELDRDFGVFLRLARGCAPGRLQRPLHGRTQCAWHGMGANAGQPRDRHGLPARPRGRFFTGGGRVDGRLVG